MVILLALIVAVGLVIYTFINTAQMFRVSGAAEVWYNIVVNDLPLLNGAIQWFPLFLGVILSFAQFVPEMAEKRLKLTLHLPMPESRIISTMLLYGIVTLLTIFILMYSAISVGSVLYYPAEIIATMSLKSLPWFIAGVYAYLLVT